MQTEEQYVFIHDALVEAIEAGETHITKACLPKYIHSLQCIDVTDEKPNPCKVLEKQYKVIREIGAETWLIEVEIARIGEKNDGATVGAIIRRFY